MHQQQPNEKRTRCFAREIEVLPAKQFITKLTETVVTDNTVLMRFEGLENSEPSK